jgi:hypothetical protein
VCVYVCMYVRMREEVRTRRHSHMPYLCVVSGFRRDIKSLLFCDVTQPTVVALVVSYPRVGAKYLSQTLEDGTDRLSRNVGN